MKPLEGLVVLDVSRYLARMQVLVGSRHIQRFIQLTLGLPWDEPLNLMSP